VDHFSAALGEWFQFATKCKDLKSATTGKLVKFVQLSDFKPMILHQNSSRI
jgi:hypothetical protein